MGAIQDNFIDIHSLKVHFQELERQLWYGPPVKITHQYFCYIQVGETKYLAMYDVDKDIMFKVGLDYEILTDTWSKESYVFDHYAKMMEI